MKGGKFRDQLCCIQFITKDSVLCGCFVKLKYIEMSSFESFGKF